MKISTRYQKSIDSYVFREGNIPRKDIANLTDKNLITIIKTWTHHTLTAAEIKEWRNHAKHGYKW